MHRWPASINGVRTRTSHSTLPTCVLLCPHKYINKTGYREQNNAREKPGVGADADAHDDTRGYKFPIQLQEYNEASIYIYIYICQGYHPAKRIQRILRSDLARAQREVLVSLYKWQGVRVNIYLDRPFGHQSVAAPSDGDENPCSKYT